MVMGTVSTVSGVISTPRRDGEWQTQINPRTLKQQKHNEAADQQMMQAGIRPAHANVIHDRGFHMYVGGLHEDNTGDMISNWLRARGITSITDISKLSPDGKPYCSFHVVLNKKDYFKIIKHKDDYWPVNVTCRCFFPPMREDEEDNVGQCLVIILLLLMHEGHRQEVLIRLWVAILVMLEVALQVARKGLVLASSLSTMILAMLVSKMLH